MPFMPGDHVGPYEILAVLGTGGMGTVYRAHDARLNRQIAIKVIQERLQSNPEYLTRFGQEARSASALNHPSIITIHDIGEVNGAPFIAMELVEGHRLRDLLKEGPVPLRKLLQVSLQIADGLAAAHERGIVHRDLKPENVMITTAGLVKVLDFGLARLKIQPSSDESTSRMNVQTERGVVLGTASYMSPEQARGKPLDHRSDQFSFGLILYEMATGTPPFNRDTTFETLSAIVHDEPEPIEKTNPRIPGPLRWLIERCLAKDPTVRYASTQDLVRDLETIRDHLSEAFTTEPLSIRTRRAAAIRRLIISGAVIAAAFATGIYLYLHKPSSIAQIPAEKYLAILPFKDLSGQPDSQLFSEGFAETVSVRLAKVSGIQVIPPSASAELFGANADFARIGRELGANLLLHGVIQRAGEQIRVTFSVVDPATKIQLAGDTLSGPIYDVFVIQDELASAVTAELRLKPSASTAPNRETGLQSAIAQDRYLRALGHLQKWDDEISVDRAISLLEELRTENAKSALVHAALGRAYLHKYRFHHDKRWSDLAGMASEQARRLNDSLPEVHLTLAEINKLTGRLDKAIEEFRRTLAYQPNSSEAALGLAGALEQSGEFSEAEKTYRHAIALRPEWWSVYNGFGVFYYKRGRYDEAKKMYEQAIRLNPDSPRSYSNLGVIYMLRGNFQAAINAYSKAISIQENAPAYSNLGHSYYYLGAYDRAAKAFEKATVITPTKSLYWSNLGDAYLLMPTIRDRAHDAYEKAIEVGSKELAVNPEDASLHAIRAFCYAGLGQRAKAREHILKALALEPQSSLRMYQAARIANRNGETEEALMWLERAFAAGYSKVEAQREPEFKNLSGNPRFEKALQDGTGSPSKS